MKRLLILTLVLICFCSVLPAQQIRRSYKGAVTDSITSMPIKEVTVSFYKAKDTSLSNFCFTTSNGNYNIELHIKDSMIMIVSCLGYKEKIFHLPEASWEWSFDVKDIKMQPALHEIGEVKITAGLISMKGDTIEINASRIKVLPNSDVSQLLQRIPGFELKKDGTIKVNGSDVSRILVDGSEFFGSNPALVAKNLDADMVDKVQVFDDKDDNGIAAKNNTKSINLKLKKGKRLGFFGDAMAGYGSNDHYEGGLRINSFRDDRKLSFISNSNNINDKGFDFGFNNWHHSSGVSRNGAADNFFGFQSGTDAGSGNLNRKSDVAFSYFNEYSRKRKLSVTLGYNNNNYISDQTNATISAITDSTKQRSTNKQTTTGQTNQLSTGVSYTKQRDTTLRFGAGISGEYNWSTKDYNSVDSIYSNNKLINGGVSDYHRDIRTFAASSNFNYYQRSHKQKFKYITVNGSSAVTNDNVTNFQYSLATGSNYNYKNNSVANGSEYLLKAAAVLPIYKTLRIGVGVDGYLSQNKYNASASSAANFSVRNYQQDYSRNIDSLAINFYNYARQLSSKLFISMGDKDYNFSMGTSYINLELYNKDETTATVVDKPYNLFLPFIDFSEWNKNAGYCSISLERTVDFPNSTQLLPLRILSNPWIRVTGNPNLLPFEQWSFNGYYSKSNYKALKNFWTGIDLNYSNDYLTTSNIIDKDGITNRVPVNLTGYFHESYSVGPTLKCSKIVNASLWIVQAYDRIPQIINGIKNLGVTSSFTAYPGLEVQVSDKTELKLDIDYSYTHYINQNNPALNFKQVIPGASVNLRTDLWKGSELKLNLDITDDRAIPGIGKVITLLNVYYQQAIDKKGKYNLKLTCYDLLDQNVGLTRTAVGSYISITQNNILQRFFMLTLIYKMKGKKTESGGATF